MLMDKEGQQEHHWPVHSVPKWSSFSQAFLASQGIQNPSVSTFGVSKMYPGPRTASHDLAHHLLSIDHLKQWGLCADGLAKKIDGCLPCLVEFLSNTRSSAE